MTGGHRTLRRSTSAFTLVELMIVVAIIGVLAAVAVPAFSRYLRKSREPENAQLLNKMWLGSIAYYAADHVTVDAQTLPKQFPGGPPGPAFVKEINFVGTYCGCLPGRKCSGGGSYWKTNPIFRALNLSQPDSHEYLAAYDHSGTGTAAAFTAVALGDLDCDDTISRYIRVGSIDPTQGDVRGQVAPFVVNPGE